MDPIRATDPWPAGTLHALPVDDAAAELLEEVLAEPAPHRRRTAAHLTRPWAAAIAAAAAVATVAGGAALWAGDGNGGPSPAPGPATRTGTATESTGPTSPSDPAGDQYYSLFCEAGVTDLPTALTSMHLENPPQGCTVRIEENHAGDGGREWSTRLRQPPPLPVLPQLPGWRLAGVDGMDARLAGPGGAHVHLFWYAAPVSGQRSDGTPPESATVLGSPTRIYTFPDGGGEFAATAGLTPDGEALLVESADLRPHEFRRLLGSLTEVSLADYREALAARS